MADGKLLSEHVCPLKDPKSMRLKTRTSSDIFISSACVGVYREHNLNFQKHDTAGMRRRLLAVSAVVSFVRTNYPEEL